MDISIKKVFNQNYYSHLWLIFSIFSPIFGISVQLSVYGVIPKFPLTENMSGLTAALVMLLCIGITIIGIISINKIIAKIKNIIDNGTMTNAVITEVIAARSQVLIKYEFIFDGETCKSKHYLERKLGYKANYSKGRDIKIFALKNKNNKIMTVPDIY